MCVQASPDTEKSITINHRETMWLIPCCISTAGEKNKERKEAGTARRKTDISQGGWVIHTVEQRTSGLGGGVTAGQEDLNDDGDIECLWQLI